VLLGGLQSAFFCSAINVPFITMKNLKDDIYFTALSKALPLLHGENTPLKTG